ncbi:SH3 domain-containing protein [Mycena amicta]|nr:SH3 domain-containing protein [Mycena amicta]
MPSLSSSSPSSSTQRAESPTIARYAPAKSPDIDPYNGSPSRDWCNCFWGVGDAGVNVLFARIRGSMQSMRELEGFWKERAAIEEEYAKRLLGLAKMVVGKEETGDLRSALDTLIFETEVQGTAHLQFASLVRNELQTPTNERVRVEKQNADEAVMLTPLEARFKTKSSAEAAVSKAREKYESNCLRLASYTQQMSVNTPNRPGKDVERLQMKIRKSRETVESNERELSIAVNAIREATVRWQEDWKEFCDISQDVEEERMDFVKDVVWGYANAVSTLCVSDDQSCERIRVALDQVDAYQDIEAFVEEYGTGNAIPEPPSWVPFPSNANAKTNGSATSARPARFARISNRPPPPPQEEMLPKQRNSRDTPPTNPGAPRTRKDSTPSVNVAINGNAQPNGIARHKPETVPVTVPPPPPPPMPVSSSPPTTFTQDARRKSSQLSLRRVSGPLPQQPGGTRSQTPAPQPPPLPTQGQGGGYAEVDPDRILFFVQALYDYTATIDEEFDFEAGDIIAVKATPDDGWWSGELLDEARRIPGRHIFPSNFITLF